MVGYYWVLCGVWVWPSIRKDWATWDCVVLPWPTGLWVVDGRALG